MAYRREGWAHSFMIPHRDRGKTRILALYTGARRLLLLVLGFQVGFGRGQAELYLAI